MEFIGSFWAVLMTFAYFSVPALGIFVPVPVDRFGPDRYAPRQRTNSLGYYFVATPNFCIQAAQIIPEPYNRVANGNFDVLAQYGVYESPRANAMSVTVFAVQAYTDTNPILIRKVDNNETYWVYYATGQQAAQQQEDTENLSGPESDSESRA